MTRTLEQVQKQIQKLQKEAEQIRAREIGDVVKRIQEAIAHYELTPADLFGGSRRKATTAAGKKRPGRPAGKRTAAKGKSTVAPKYRDESGNTWSGRGRQPRWLVAALAEGRKIEDFAIGD